MKESDVEKYLHKQIEGIGGTTRKWVSPGRVGVPDRICILPSSPGFVFFVEVKTDKGKLSVRQEREIQTLRSFGVRVYIVKGFNGVDKLIQELTKQC